VVLEVQLEAEAPEVFRVNRVPEVLQDKQVPLVHKGHKEPQDRKVFQDRKV
jgi:hypothetical protein